MIQSTDEQYRALANFLVDYLAEWERGNSGCAAIVPKRSNEQFYGGVREGFTQASQAIRGLLAENAKLREALDYIAGNKPYPDIGKLRYGKSPCVSNDTLIARKALKGDGDE